MRFRCNPRVFRILWDLGWAFLHIWVILHCLHGTFCLLGYFIFGLHLNILKIKL